MSQIEIEYQLRMDRAHHISSGTGVGRWVDRTVTRDADGLPYIPGSTVKGKVRSHCEALTSSLRLRTCGRIEMHQGRWREHPLCKTDTLCILCRLFGSPFTPNMLVFTDARLIQWQRDLHMGPQEVRSMSPDVEWRSGTQLSRARRTVLERHLFTIEHSCPGLTYTGRIFGEGRWRDPSTLLSADSPPLELVLLLAGLRSVTHLGGGLSRGLGRCRVEILRLALDGQQKPIEWDQLLSLDALEGFILYEDLPDRNA